MLVAVFFGFIGVWFYLQPEPPRALINTTNQSGGNNTVITNPPPQYIEEKFQASDLKNNFTPSSSPQEEILNLELKEYPVPGSLNIWHGALSLPPTDYWALGKQVKIRFLKGQADFMKSIIPGSIHEPMLSFVIRYIPDSL